MTRYPTHLDDAWGPVDRREVALAFQADLIERLLGVVWSAYDELCEAEFRRVDWDKPLRNVERSICASLHRAIQLGLRRHFDGYTAVTVGHESEELETQLGNAGHAPTYDLAFEWPGDPRIMWGIEAKALKNDRDTESGPGEYIRNGVERFLRRRYAPFTTSGAMVALLRSGSAATLSGHIATRLGTDLLSFPPFAGREHRVSEHQRLHGDVIGRRAFTCHHLVFELASL